MEKRKLKDFPKTAKPSAHSIPHSWNELKEQHTGIRSSLILYLQHSSKPINQVQKKQFLYPGLASNTLPISCNYIIFIYFLLFLLGGQGCGIINEPETCLKSKRNPCLQRNKGTDSNSCERQSGTLLQLWGPLMVRDSCHKEILPGRGEVQRWLEPWVWGGCCHHHHPLFYLKFLPHQI